MVNAFVQQTDEFPNKSKKLGKNLYVKTPNYLKEDGQELMLMVMVSTSIPILGSGSFGGSFNDGGYFGIQMLTIHLTLLA